MIPPSLVLIWGPELCKILLILGGISWKQALRALQGLGNQDHLLECPSHIPSASPSLPAMDTHPLSQGCYRGPEPPGLPPPGWLLFLAPVSGASGHGFGGADDSAGPVASEPLHTEFYDLKRSGRSVETTKGGVEKL